LYLGLIVKTLTPKIPVYRFVWATKVKKAAMLVIFGMFATLSQANVTDDLKNANLTLIDIIQRAIANSVSIETVVSEAIRASPRQSSSIIGAAIAVTPGSIAVIVETAIKAGAKSEVIAQHCKSALTTNEVEQIVTSAMLAKVKPEPIIRTCLAVVPEDEVTRLLALALANADESFYDRVIASAFDTVDSLEMNAMSLVSNGLVQSGITIDGQELANQQMAMNMVEDLVGTPAFATEADRSPVSAGEAAALLDRPEEGPASAS